MDNLGLIAGIVGGALVLLIIIGISLARMFQRATKEISYVKTGFGGEKVIKDGGCIVLPVLHELTPVRMNTLKLMIERKMKDALITKDRMRVDVQADFYLRVQPELKAISRAAQTLGDKTLNPEKLKQLMEGKFVDALRSVAAQMTMEELHEKRSDFVQQVQDVVTEDLTKNGLELETVSLTGLDQTAMEHFDENNAFDAEGKTKLTEIVESRRKRRNDIEQETSVQIKAKNLEAEKQRLTISKDEELAKASQVREIAIQSAEEKSATEKATAEQVRIAKEAEIAAQQAIQAKKIQAEQKIQQETIDKEKAIEIANQDKAIAIAEKSEMQSAADAKANLERAKAVQAEEQVKTAREKEAANRAKSIAVIKAEEEAEEKAVGIKVQAAAEKAAASDRADAKKLEAKGEADAIIVQADADERRYAVDAEGKEKLHEAENKLSAEIIAMRIQMETIGNLQGIVEASVKPMEKIDGMKIINVAGLGGNGSTGEGGAPAGDSNMTDQLVNGLLKYRAQVPILDHIMKEVGLDGSSIQGLVEPLSKGVETAKVEQIVDASTDEPAPSQPATPGKPQSPALKKAGRLL